MSDNFVIYLLLAVAAYLLFRKLMGRKPDQAGP